MAGVIASFLTLSRAWAQESKPLIRGAIRITVVAILFPSAHFAEELVTGTAHPLLSVLAGGYFPGLVTSPVAGLPGIPLLRRLALVTQGNLPRGGI